MSLELEEYQRGHVQIISISGDLNRENVSQFNSFFKPILGNVLKSSRIFAIAVDCENLRTIDSSGIGALVGKILKLKKKDKKLVLCSLNKVVQWTLDTTGLSSAFPLYSSVHEVIRSIGPEKLKRQEPKEVEPKGNAGKSEEYRPRKIF